MKTYISLFCAVLLAVPATGQDATKEGSTPLYPLKQGTAWTYKAGNDSVVIRVKGTTKIDKEDATELETSIGGVPMGTEHVVVRADGVYRLKVGDQLITPPFCFLKLPAKKGETWTANSSVGSEKLEGELTIEEEEIEWNKDKGKQKAVVVKAPELLANAQSMSLTSYYVENVGMVKQVAKIAGAEVVLELQKYEPPTE